MIEAMEVIRVREMIEAMDTKGMIQAMAETPAELGASFPQEEAVSPEVMAAIRVDILKVVQAQG